MVADGSARLPQGKDLGVCRRIGVSQVAIPAAPDYFAVAQHYRADRDISYMERALRGT
jgi:hypothetical protein